MTRTPVAEIWADISSRLASVVARERRWGQHKVKRVDMMIGRVVNYHVSLGATSGLKEWLERKVAATPMRDTDRQAFAEYFQSLPTSAPPLLHLKDHSE